MVADAIHGIAGHRVSFYAATALLIASSGLACSASQALPQQIDTADAPRNVIYLIADGMGVPMLSTASTILANRGARLAMESMPVVGLLHTYTSDSLVAESASSATALASGVRTLKGRVGIDSRGGRVPTIMELARDAGLATGIITTSYLWDATPASFAAHVFARKQPDSIAVQMIASGFDFLIGGDDGSFQPHLGRARERGYGIASDMQELDRNPDLQVLGLFEQRTTRGSYGPRMSLTTTWALERLEGADRPFLLMIEQEETDNAGHSNDLDRVADGVREFDDAVALALAFAQRRGDTLVIVTADHDAGGLGETDKLGFGWLTRGHTGQWVPILAFGPGAESFSGIYYNTEVPKRIGRLLGLDALPHSQ